MTRGRFYAITMPIAAIVYVIIGLIVGSPWWAFGALLFPIVAVVGIALRGAARKS